jgi:hypothetical protein
MGTEDLVERIRSAAKAKRYREQKKKLEVKPVLTLSALKIHTIMYGEKLGKEEEDILSLKLDPISKPLARIPSVIDSSPLRLVRYYD